jgi:hypothetical protein
MNEVDLLDLMLDHFVARVTLEGERCNLNHGKGVDTPEAIDYLCQYVGNTDIEYVGITDIKVADDLLRIPICKECITALYNERYLLFYCLNCNSSQWLIKSQAKKLYPAWESIKFLSACPRCCKRKT